MAKQRSKKPVEPEVAPIEAPADGQPTMEDMTAAPGQGEAPKESEATADGPAKASGDLGASLGLSFTPRNSLAEVEVVADDVAARFRVQIMSRDGKHGHLSGVITGAGVFPVQHGKTYDVRYQRIGYRERGPWQKHGDVVVPARIGLTKAGKQAV